MPYRRYLDSATSCVVWFKPWGGADDVAKDRYTIVFYGRYYVKWDETTGRKQHLCLCCDCAGDMHYWKEYEIRDYTHRDGFGEQVPWGRLPAGIQQLIMSEYRNGIQDYVAKPITQCPWLMRRNDESLYGNKK